MCCRISHTSTHFNSRPSARGDQLQPVQGEGWHISIHAPPRGATRSAACASRHAQFQFTPLREGRPHSAAVRCFSAAFQFTPLREGRLVMPQGRTRGGISIHAPPRGATHTPHKPWHGRHFNSRPSARGDRTPTAGSAGGRISIHAPPRGATEYAIGRVVETNFNSRPSARGDDGGVARRNRRVISIHAPPRGATARAARRAASFPPLISIHAPPRGATFPASGSPGVGKISIHAPPRGATLFCALFRLIRVIFQFTPLREGRLPGRVHPCRTA